MNNNLKQARKQANLTQQDVANSLFITRQTISRWETGVREPSITAINDLAKLYKVSVPELLGYKIELQKKTNYFAILGSLFFNVCCVIPVSFSIILVLFIGWIFSITFLGFPLLALYNCITNKTSIQFVIYNYQPQGFIEVFLYILTFIVGLAMTYVMWRLSKFISHGVGQYCRYTFRSVRYDVLKK